MRARNILAVAALLLAASGAAQTSSEITVKDGETQVIKIAEGSPNRIVTPYESANLITNVEHEAWAVGGVLYVLPMDEEHTMAGFIQNDSGEWAIPVIFEVSRIPPQEVRLNDPRYEPTAKKEGGEGLPDGSSSSHVDRVTDLLVQALNEGEIPGFRQENPDGTREVYVGPMRMRLEHAQRRGSTVIERHRITHEGMETREISEASFSVPGRLGVMVYPPMTEMAPGEEAHVFIARRARNE